MPFKWLLTRNERLKADVADLAQLASAKANLVVALKMKLAANQLNQSLDAASERECLDRVTEDLRIRLNLPTKNDVIHWLNQHGGVTR